MATCSSSIAKKVPIKTSGFQVWPREIEEVLASHASVAEVGVADEMDPVKGEVWRRRGLRSGPTRRRARPTCARSAASDWPAIRCPPRSSSGPNCRKRWSARLLRALKKADNAPAREPTLEREVRQRAGGGAPASGVRMLRRVLSPVVLLALFAASGHAEADKDQVYAVRFATIKDFSAAGLVAAPIGRGGSTSR